ncbi:hypothetical protein [Sporosarcina obsidiansis]|uniref:hypothetical protein n=1 Tax=Sporosarcina obsidiansis TaxID=2660748 RepID=UPI00129AEDA4|nr:hypothetical protein [Sporosarcina obsidiansis]
MNPQGDISRELREGTLKDEELDALFKIWEETKGTSRESFALESKLKYYIDEAAAVRELELHVEEAEFRIREATLKTIQEVEQKIGEWK